MGASRRQPDVTGYALAQYLGIPFLEVEDVVTSSHSQRTRNERGGDWKVSGRGLTVIYNHPDGDDTTAALVVTLWRQR